MSAARARALDVAVWLLLLFMPFWMTAIGGYTELATRIVVMGLAAMSLNFLLGFTGVLSFGHAAYFGLGAYGAAMTIKYLDAEHDRRPSWSASSSATIAAMIIGALIVRLRGVYFAMVTIAFGQVFYFIAFRWNAVTGGDDGLTGWHRLPIDFGFARARHSSATTRRSTISCSRSSRSASARWRCFSTRRSGARCIAIRENERRARFLGVPVELHIWLSFVISCLFVSLAGSALCAAQQLHRSARAALSTSRAISSSWRCWAACARSGGR